MSAPSTARDKASKPVVLPAALRAGDAIRLISPASWFDPNKVHVGMDSVRALGLQPQLGAHALARYGQYSAGTPEQRLEDLHTAFSDPSVKAIICNRGGYGSAEMLNALDLDLIRRNPKIFVACSDITSLETYIHDQTGLVVFHGPMAAGDFARPNGVDPISWQAALWQDSPWQLGVEAGLRTLKPGRAHGRFYGGCLSMLVASLGTPYEVQTAGAILFLEDIGAKPYQIDRMLLQLRLAGKLADVRAIVFGPMLDCVQPGTANELLDAVLLRVLADFAGPVAIGLRSGHVLEQNITVPIGVESELDLTNAPTLRFQPSVACNQGSR
ncbi:MAG TPA: LD-carboxypeptidase [Acidobacteriaceae bacterium]|nr:LD-carboxypeptidase [Acidobacteriaceae bacterium]